MFFYFGRKARAARTYPAPEYPIVIEPFAGSMGYTLHHRPPQAIGVEKDPLTHALWHRIVNMTADEIANYPTPVVGERTEDRWVIEASVSSASALSSYRTVTKFMVIKFEEQRAMALRCLDYAQSSILYSLGDYRQAPDIEATWLIDPPYQGIKEGYRHGSNSIDYEELAEWCMTRKGDVIACEGPEGSWLPFKMHGKFQGQANPKGGHSKPNVEHVLVRRTHAKCAACKITFPASRADARYCSSRCRMRVARAAAKSEPTPRRRVIRRR